MAKSKKFDDFVEKCRKEIAEWPEWKRAPMGLIWADRNKRLKDLGYEELSEEEKEDNLKNNLDKYMNEAAKRVLKWPKWKQNIGLMDKDRQYNRYEPLKSKNKDG